MTSVEESSEDVASNEPDDDNDAKVQLKCNKILWDLFTRINERNLDLTQPFWHLNFSPQYSFSGSGLLETSETDEHKMDLKQHLQQLSSMIEGDFPDCHYSVEGLRTERIGATLRSSVEYELIGAPPGVRRKYAAEVAWDRWGRILTIWTMAGLPI
ncbi:hypothetical protein PRZ48_003003 [Zasmidium cellare]|uniref:SnoaL-like domain-containing protein n=1 Tax=Zasmidium cellare TaxID=395010 RepID=A0ABR0EUB1_ZASCE|nr:hypothetical protein PRZ48_003003 [Zasmidium cellare]